VTVAACLVLAAVCVAAGATRTLALRRRLELIARAEHELRGPVTALTLACERMGRDPRAARHAAVLRVQLDRLHAGLTDLDAARRGGQAGRRLDRVDVATVARASLEPWRSVLRRCSFEWGAGEAAAVGDRRRLAQALGNLVANSAEHGAGDLRVRASRVGGAVRLELRNRNRPAPGAGPQAADEPAERADRGRGIPIAARAARDLGGRLLVRVGERETVAVLEIPEDRPPEGLAA
jgi:signal transduction histidine kinase